MNRTVFGLLYSFGLVMFAPLAFVTALLEASVNRDWQAGREVLRQYGALWGNAFPAETCPFWCKLPKNHHGSCIPPSKKQEGAAQ